MKESHTRLLPGHHVQYAVLSLIEEAAERVVLVSAYVQTWEPLRIVLRNAIRRRVRIDLITRSPDGESGSADRLKDEVVILEDMGVVVHFVPRLHAKMYVSEKAAVVTSFNLVDASQSSFEMGVLLTDPELVLQCLTAAQEACESLYTSVPARNDDLPKEHGSAPGGNGNGYCIGCGDPNLRYDPAYPLCPRCYRESAAGEVYKDLAKRVCHACGKAHRATLGRPLCKACFGSQRSPH